MTFVPAGKQGGGSISDLYMGECEVTNAEFRLFMNEAPGFTHSSAWYTTPSTPAYENLPAESVSWYEAVQYCNWKTVNTPGLTSGDCAYTPKTYNQPAYTYVAGKKGYRLANNAGTTGQSEWEYACRAGTTTDYYWGEDCIPVDGMPANIDLFCWYLCNCWPGPGGNGVQIAGQKIPNAWGLYDMSGNVMEWCNDEDGALRVVRGGSWNDSDPGFCRSVYFSTCSVSTPHDYTGFRLVRTK